MASKIKNKKSSKALAAEEEVKVKKPKGDKPKKDKETDEKPEDEGPINYGDSVKTEQRIMPVAKPSEVKDNKDGTLRIGDRKIVKPVKGDFVILLEEDGKNKKVLAEVTRVNDEKKIVQVVHEKFRYDDDARVETRYPYGHLVYNLGPNPEEGNIYGVKIERWYGSFETKMGIVQVFRPLEDKDKKVIVSILDECYNKMLDWRIHTLLPLEIWVIKAAGKMIGTYSSFGDKTLPGTEKPMIDRITLKDKDYRPQFLRLLVIHELGHGMWNKILTKREKAGWIQTYHEFVQLKDFKQKRMLSVLKDYKAAGSSYDPPNDDDEAIFDEAIEHISELHRLEREHLDDLIEGGAPDFIDDMWPDAAATSSQEDIVSEYANTSPVEFWCEALSLHMVGRKIPKAIADKVDNTMKAIYQRQTASPKKKGKPDEKGPKKIKSKDVNDKVKKKVTVDEAETPKKKKKKKKLKMMSN